MTSVFAYYDADTNGTVYHVMPSPEPQSAPSSFYSESDSTMTGTTIQSDYIPGYFVLHHGRQQPASDNAVRWWPPDNIRRYILRYLVIKFVFGGDLIGPAKEILAPIDGCERQVLELGTRTGTWIQAMASEFPHVHFRSLDLVPVIGHIPRRNVVFEVYDFTEGILLEDESQDIVFLNGILELIKDYRALLCEVHRVLRPGGLICVNDFNPDLWDPNDITVPAQHTNPRGCHVFSIVRRHIFSLGVDPDTCDKIPQWLASKSDLWVQSQKGFRGINSVIRTYPSYPHEGCVCMGQMDERIASYARCLAALSWKDVFGLLKDAGTEETEASRLIEDVLEEIKQPGRCGLIKLYCIYAVKI